MIGNVLNIPYVIRAPIIPTLNDRKDHFDTLKKLFLKHRNCQRVQIMPYHVLGNYKYDQLDRKYECADINEPSTSDTEYWQTLAE